jgi:hypothetical protein
VSHAPAHGNYAFFTSDAAQLAAALKKIALLGGTGDYSFSGPSVASSTSSTGKVGFIASAAYPQWLGHLYAYDLSKPITCTTDADCPTVANGAGRCLASGDCKPPDTYPLLWDAGGVLSAFTRTLSGSFVLKTSPQAANNGVPRSIYTWDPSREGLTSNALVEVTAANAGTINTLCGGCGIDAQVVDFIRGNDGNGNPRVWDLGALINSTAGIIVGTPEEWKQFPGHSVFEKDYESRQGVAWVGSSDGMLHCLDLKDGAELLALLPPDKLGLEKELYDNYKTDPVANPLGELADAAEHLYGLANSPRFADVFDPTLGVSGGYRTILYMTEGPGGTGLHAIDITHPFPGRGGTAPLPAYLDGSTQVADHNYGYPGTTFAADKAPVQPLWSLTHDGAGGTTILDALQDTWSIPAVGGTSAGTNWELVLGNGYTNYDPSDPNTADPYPRYLRLDPLYGTVRGNQQLTHLSSDQPLGGPWVRNQALADSTIWSTSAPYYRPDNDVNQGVQLDLQGRVWLLDRTDMVSTNWNAPVTMSDPSGLIAGQPLYYSAAVATYPTDNPLFDVYAFSSGSFYENRTTINGATTGITGATPPNFIPSIYLIAQPVSGGSPIIYKKDIHTITFGTDNSEQFGPKTQITAYPTLFVPQQGYSGPAIALYLVYDPDAGACNGNAYLVRVDFNPATLGTVDPVITVDNAGEGAASGFALAGDVPVVAKSFIGPQGRAYFYTVKNLKIIGAGGKGPEIAWWRELQ